MRLGDPFPDFAADSSAGAIRSFHEWVGDSWAILFSHPSDFTPVCTTELAKAVELNDEFKQRGVKLIALSCDSVESHHQWIADIIAFNLLKRGAGESSDKFPFPIIADEERRLATRLGMLDPLEVDSNGLPLTARAVFVIDSRKKMRLSLLYPATTGRNFDEVLRVVDSLQLTDRQRVATPVDWKPGAACVVQPSVSTEEEKTLFGGDISHVELPSGKTYMRFANNCK